jgi:hypothetical protein
LHPSPLGFVLRRQPVRRACALLACAAVAGLACEAPLDPYPQPLPPNIDIVATPAAGDTLDAAAADSVVLQFDHRMDPESLWLVRRISFLLPLTVDHLDGTWNVTRTRLVFNLNRFPVQPGATYEALLVGLRTAAGELYNGGPYPILFYTRGVPDLFPIPAHSRLAGRDFCRRPAGSTGDCTELLTLVSAPFGADSLLLATTCEDCGGFRRADFFRKTTAGIEWLGFDLPDGDARQSVRWPAPPLFVGATPEPGATWTAPAQRAADGTQLLAWNVADTGIDAPAARLSGSNLPIQVTFPASHVLRFDFTLEFASGVREHRRERWWLHPGVGLVRREIHVERSDAATSSDVVDVYEPGLSILLP